MGRAGRREFAIPGCSFPNFRSRGDSLSSSSWYFFSRTFCELFLIEILREDGVDVEGGPKCGQRCVPSVQRGRAGHEEGSVLRAAFGRRCAPVGARGTEMRCGTDALDACLLEFSLDIQFFLLLILPRIGN